MASVIEQIRTEHEDIERLQRLIVNRLNDNVVTKKETILRDHEVSGALDIAVKKAKDLLNLYDDKSKVWEKEIAVLSGKVSEPYTSFYTSLKELKTYHANHPGIDSVDYVKKLPKSKVTFSGEEAYGKHLDLHHIYDIYINLSGIQKVSYLSYLDIFYKFDAIPRSIRITSGYAMYVEKLLRYLEDFYKRTQPLVEWKEVVSETTKGFDKEWEVGTCSGWERNVKNGVDIDTLKDVKDLLSLGSDVLKEALSSRGLKCGGTLQQKAGRLWAVRGLSVDAYPASLLAGSNSKANKRRRKRKATSKINDNNNHNNGVKVSKQSTSANPSEITSKRGLREIAEMEFRVISLIELLMDVIIPTKTFTEKKLVRSYEERLAESREQEEADRIIAEDNAAGSDDEEEAIYNPLNLPLGWDGKPIPYWLYKLHGLSVTYTCEICGNASYRGRRAFDLHFQEHRHAHGMRCLGIPNTKHFHDITNIQDALDLYQKLKSQNDSEMWDQSTQEEYEDSEGNVLSKKMFQDLSRQGLL